MVWYGMIWYDMIWYMIWYIWYIWYDMIWYMTWYHITSYHIISYHTTWVRPVLGTSCLGYELSWVRVILGTSCPGYELSWVWVILGTSCPGYELSWVRIVQIPDRICFITMPSHGRYVVSNHPQFHRLFMFMLTHIKETLKSALLALCKGNSPETGEFPAQRASNVEKASICVIML